MGTELLATGSVLAAFFAGGVALFAPCCIVFLAPSYLAGAVKNRLWRLLPLTFVFAAGLALVLVPITLGVSMIAGAINQYHAQLYWAGGLLMIALAVLSLSGRMWSLPSFLRAPDTSRGDTASFFALGVFSGIASSCCAPVLAGVMALSALSGSAAGGVVLGLAYVFGMVFPLFVMALVWDRTRLGERTLFRARLVKLRLGSRVLVTSTVNLAVAIGFTVMGVWVITLAGSGTMTGGTAMQTAVGEWLADVLGRFQVLVAPVPEPVLGLALMALAGAFVVVTLRDRRRDDARGASCHEPHDHEPATASDQHDEHRQEGLPR
ncbi:cytochrome c biogenesis CcdA family protein [Georgenia sp. EYE_87]|uniref:cytochrome c biogenesis CcdA family protein n=1 Tax=Georgenia sp. EYE_87 TaxID=2853448 RepID=UPI0020036E12|nr:cytochrome c biogenesis CcdA family protein [Georgenia sp. EYE_87]MCK6210317.1 cytochrome c biogenesis CcdA family protein [Georgenia sp. EYE_87]